MDGGNVEEWEAVIDGVVREVDPVTEEEGTSRDAYQG